eukprot:scaffold331_cov243-Pinguiococcus_pyrenoidosus.AAC.2
MSPPDRPLRHLLIHAPSHHALLQRVGKPIHRPHDAQRVHELQRGGRKACQGNVRVANGSPLPHHFLPTICPWALMAEA